MDPDHVAQAVFELAVLLPQPPTAGEMGVRYTSSSLEGFQVLGLLDDEV